MKWLNYLIPPLDEFWQVVVLHVLQFMAMVMATHLAARGDYQWSLIALLFAATLMLREFLCLADDDEG